MVTSNGSDFRFSVGRYRFESGGRDMKIKLGKEAEMVTIDMSGTGKKIKAQMVCADLTARDIADACDLANPNAVWRWQKGQIMPTIDNLVIMADACGCKVDDLIAVK